MPIRDWTSVGRKRAITVYYLSLFKLLEAISESVSSLK